MKSEQMNAEELLWAIETRVISLINHPTKRNTDELASLEREVLKRLGGKYEDFQKQI